MEIKFKDYHISDNKELLDVNIIKDFLSRSYWANQRTTEQIEKSIQTSTCYGVYHHNKQIGFARVISDQATMYYLCDVFIDNDYRGEGIGKKLIESITTSEEFKNLTGVLGTKDAHQLYKQFDFIHDKERFMRRAPDYMRK